jgi:hypothetical protein
MIAAARGQQELAQKQARARQDMIHKEQTHRMKLRQQAEQRAAQPAKPKKEQ